MSRLLLRTLGAAALFALAAPAFAQSVNGCWATVDDADGTVKSYVKIYDEGGTKVGDIVRLTASGGRCVDCADRFNGRVLRNERIMSGFRADGNRYEDGTILDPKSGRSYSAVMNLMENNSDRLYLRGYIGIPTFGRSQTWRRVPASNCQ